jgi:membrane glycosyltransferase
MLQVVRFASMTLLQGMMIFFFAVSLGWIAFAAGSVLAGASKRRAIPAADPAGRVADRLVMPIYNEDPRRTMTALQAMAEALAKIGANRGFEIVVLSDSTDADAWIRETLSVDRLRSALVGIMPVWYRRRWQNIARKSGNVEDFVTRWGGRYDFMIVLDADSLIDAPTLLRLAETMQATQPRDSADRSAADRREDLVRPPAAIRRLRLRTRDHARPRGLVGRFSGNYWGHNAIIRMARSRRAAACRSSRAASLSAASCCRTTSSRPR